MYSNYNDYSVQNTLSRLECSVNNGLMPLPLLPQREANAKCTCGGPSSIYLRSMESPWEWEPRTFDHKMWLLRTSPLLRDTVANRLWNSEASIGPPNDTWHRPGYRECPKNAEDYGDRCVRNCAWPLGERLETQFPWNPKLLWFNCGFGFNVIVTVINFHHSHFVTFHKVNAVTTLVCVYNYY